MNEEVMTELKKIMSIFPDSFLNRNFELILIPKTNTYFLAEDCLSKRDIIAKLLMWCSRDASKGAPFKNRTKNLCFQEDNRSYLNYYLGTEFSREDINLIYQKLGNGVRPAMTYEFIDGGFDMKILKEVE